MKYIVAFLLPAILVLLLNRGLDNDSWYVLTEGRYIVENGVYYTDVFSMHEGLNVTVQNYGFAVIFYLLFSVFGAPGLYVGMLILNFLICWLIFKICMLISGKNVNLSLFIMVLTDFMLGLGFVVTRAQMVSFVILLTLIYLLELYIKTDKTKFLWWVPLLSVLQINLHASVWWMLIFVLIVYIIDSIKKPKLHLQGYRTKPLALLLVATLLSGLINPYGAQMILFIFKSYGDSRFHDLVVELSAFSPLGGIWNAFVYILIVSVILLHIFGKKKNVRMRYLLMFFGFLALGLNTVKGMSQFTLIMFFPLALLYKDVKLEKAIDAKIGRDALMFWMGLICFSVFVMIGPIVIGQVKDYPSEALLNALNSIDDDVKANGDKGTNVYTEYTGYNDGGYVEYRGYKAYLDPRGEVFLKKNNGKEDILYEWADFKAGEITASELLEKYNFDYILVRENDPFYDYEFEDYEMIFEDTEEEVRVFRKVKSVSLVGVGVGI